MEVGYLPGVREVALLVFQSVISALAARPRNGRKSFGF